MTSSALKADQARQDDRLDAVRDRSQSRSSSQYEGEGLSAVGQVVVSDDPGAFLVAAHHDVGLQRPPDRQLFDDYSRELKALEIRREATERRRPTQIAELEQQLAQREGRRSTTSSPRPRSCSADLEAEERERDARASRSGDHAGMPNVPASGRAAAAVAVRHGPGR